ncbi:hypothetical protein T05_11404 [Trichinella murrelli]|uniref:Uncharacterized protein n=1 Tax=Trichinella murrelli TaxID=144512 RepID=A0A0V0U0A1_9BILA|nr:hypothetical protein T05_11404 [Trichinella murrelli]
MHVFILENLSIILALLFLYHVENALRFGDIAILYCKMTAVGSARKFKKNLGIIFYIFIWFYIKSLVSCIDD